MPDVRLIRTLVILSLALPAITMLAAWGDSADRVAQLHPVILAGTQLLVSLLALLTEATEREASRSAHPDRPGGGVGSATTKALEAR